MNSMVGSPLLWVLIGVGSFAVLGLGALLVWALSSRSKGGSPRDASRDGKGS